MFTGFLPKLFVGKDWELVIIHNNTQVEVRALKTERPGQGNRNRDHHEAMRQASPMKTFKQMSEQREKW